MKPTLLVGLGNPLMGDDSVGSCVVDTMRRRGLVPTGVETLLAGTDLLRHADRLAGRGRVLIVDATADGRPPGTVRFLDLPLDDAIAGQPSAHQLSALEAVRLLQLLDPAVARTRFTLATVSVAAPAVAEGLSQPLAEALPHIVEWVAAALD